MLFQNHTLLNMNDKLSVCLCVNVVSMEECEALCTRMAIMVNGRFQCIGSTQHLKTKFGEGYTLIVKVRQSFHSDADKEDSDVVLKERMEMKIHQVMEFVKVKFSGSQLKDRHNGLLYYWVVPDTDNQVNEQYLIIYHN